MAYDQYGNYYDDAQNPYGYVTDPSGQPVGTQGPPPPPASPGLGALASGAGVGAAQASGAVNAFQGKNLNPVEAAALALPTGGFSLAYNPVKKFLGNTFGSNNPERERRDALASAVADQSLGGSLKFSNPGGQQFNIGSSSYNVDFDNPLSHQAVGYANPFAEYLAAKYGDQKNQAKLRSDFAGQLANTFMTGAADAQGVKNSGLAFLEKWGVQPQEIRTGITELYNQKKIDANQFNAYLAAITNLVDPGPRGPQDLSGFKPVHRPANQPAKNVPMNIKQRQQAVNQKRGR